MSDNMDQPWTDDMMDLSDLSFLDKKDEPELPGERKSFSAPKMHERPKSNDVFGRPDPNLTDISQSMIKAMRFDKITGDAEACPARIRAAYIKGMKFKPSEAMTYGLYFETQVLGCTRGKGAVTDLPRTASTNKKTAVHDRLDAQVGRFKQEVAPNFGLVIGEDNVQLEYFMKLDKENYQFVLHPDLISPIRDPTLDPDHDIPMAVIDVKTTESIFNSFGDFAWAVPATMDHMQAASYSLAMAQGDPDYSAWFQRVYPGQGIFPFYYLIMEYGTGMRYKWVRKRVMPNDVAEMKQTIRRTIGTLEQWKAMDWEERPSYKDCNECPLAATCSKYRIGKEIEVI